jgi:hypothetical protein
MKPSFGSIESIQDKRTVFADELDKADGQLPPQSGSVFLNFPSCDDLSNQRQLGVCTHCAVRLAVEEAFAANSAIESSGKVTERLSEYWGYLMGKILFDGNMKEGSSALTMLKNANKNGVPSKEIEKKYPLFIDGTYQEFITDFNQRYEGVIPEEVMKDALRHKIDGYYRVPVEPVSIAKEITKGKLVIVRFTVGDNTYKDSRGNVTWNKDELSPLREPKTIDGGHLWVIKSYYGLGENQVCTLVNSWSKRWCDNGCIDFIFKTQKPYFTEAWAIGEVPFTLIEEKKKNDFKKDLKIGSVDSDVKRLQEFLNNKGYRVSFFGAGSKGKETNIFGPATRGALIKFQKANNIVPAIGIFGSITRGIVNSLQ